MAESQEDWTSIEKLKAQVRANEDFQIPLRVGSAQLRLLAKKWAWAAMITLCISLALSVLLGSGIIFPIKAIIDSIFAQTILATSFLFAALLAIYALNQWMSLRSCLADVFVMMASNDAGIKTARDILDRV